MTEDDGLGWLHQWEKHLKGSTCPITGRTFFVILKHPELGWVPTYGGPYDSYTVPELDDTPHGADVTMSSYHYDHDRGGWADRETAREVVVDGETYNSLVSDLRRWIEEVGLWVASMPRCSWGGCNKLGTKWITRHTVNCDDHGDQLSLSDVPWAELARKVNAAL